MHLAALGFERGREARAGFREKHSLHELLRRPEMTYDSVVQLADPAGAVADRVVAAQVEVETKYAGYIERQRGEVARRQSSESLRLPADLDYSAVRGLSVEAQQKLERHRPETVGQAGRIPGITPAAISLLLVHLKRGFKPAKKIA